MPEVAQCQVAIEAMPERSIVSSEMVTSEGAKRRLIQLDFVRGIAILMVMGRHFMSVPTKFPLFNGIEFELKRLGWSGVDLFFVLSGFLVGGLLIGEIHRTGSLRVGRFIVRRGFKIWPGYYAFILFELVTRHFPPSTFLLANMLHLQNYLGTSLNHTWTLAVEEHFYLLIPLLLVWICSARRTRSNVPGILASLCVAVLLIRVFMVVGMGSSRVEWYTHTRIDSLLFGVLMSYFYHFRRSTFDACSRQRLLLACLTACGVVFLSLVPQRSMVMQTIGYSVNYICFGAFILLMLGVSGVVLRSVPYRIIAAIGVYSYGIYLWHNSVRTPLLHVCKRLPVSDDMRWLSLFVSQYICAVALGVLMSKLIEWPTLRIRERLVPA
jgi:peptidoglycan/LPS O-acetylase OafA/YrhL